METQDRPLQEILVEILGTEASGCLTVASGSMRRQFFFTQGGLCACLTDIASEQFGTIAGEGELAEPPAIAAEAAVRALLGAMLEADARLEWTDDASPPPYPPVDGQSVLTQALERRAALPTSRKATPAGEADEVSVFDDGVDAGPPSGGETYGDLESLPPEHLDAAETTDDGSGIEELQAEEVEHEEGGDELDRALSEETTDVLLMVQAEELFRKAEYALSKGRLQDAHRGFRLATERDATAIEYRAWYGYTTFAVNHQASEVASGRGLEMIQGAMKAAEDGNNPRIQAVCWRLIARTLVLQGEETKARGALWKALEVRPEDEDAKLELKRLEQKIPLDGKEAQQKGGSLQAIAARRAAAKHKNKVAVGTILIAILVVANVVDRFRRTSADIGMHNLAANYPQFTWLEGLYDQGGQFMAVAKPTWSGGNNGTDAAVACAALAKALLLRDGQTVMISDSGGFPKVICQGDQKADEIEVLKMGPGPGP